MLLEDKKLADLKKLPEDNIQLTMGPPPAPSMGPPPAPSAPDKAVPTAPGTEAPSVFAASMVSQENSDSDDGLGLPTDAGKAKGKAKSKPKRTRAEVVKEDTEKMIKEVDTLTKDLSGFPDKPTPSSIARVDRMLSKKITSFKDSFDFEAAGDLSKLQAKVALVRACVKPASGFLTGTLATRKKTQDEFVRGMKEFREAHPEDFDRIPSSARAAFEEVMVNKTVEDQNWTAMASILDSNNLEKLQMDPKPLLERILSVFMKDVSAADGPALERKISGIGKELAEALEVVSTSSTEGVKAMTSGISSVVKRVPMTGSKTLEEGLSMVMTSKEQPVFRILHDTSVGTILLNLAKKENDRLVAQLEAASSLETCETFFAKVCEMDITALLDGDEGEHKDLEQILDTMAKKCNILSSLVKLSTDSERPSIISFGKAAKHLMDCIVPALKKAIEPTTAQISEHVIIDVQAEPWTAIIAHPTMWLQTVCNRFAVSGEVHTLLNSLSQQKVMQKDLADSFSQAIDISRSVTCLVEIRWKN